MQQSNKKIRDSFFDNYKALLILCVVVGHFLDHFTSDFRIAEILRIYIYFFHIPAFSFISGYFARKNNFQLLIQKLLFLILYFKLFITSCTLESGTTSNSHYYPHSSPYGIYWHFLFGDSSLIH